MAEDNFSGIGESLTIVLDREWLEQAGLIAFIGAPEYVPEGFTYKVKILKPSLNGEYDTIFFMTIEEALEYENKLNDKSQGNRCAICFKHGNKKDRLYVDHNHKTGKVRGLLCRNCNFAIGLLNEDLSRLQNIKSYLTKYNENK